MVERHCSRGLYMESEGVESGLPPYFRSRGREDQLWRTQGKQWTTQRRAQSQSTQCVRRAGRNQNTHSLALNIEKNLETEKTLKGEKGTLSGLCYLLQDYTPLRRPLYCTCGVLNTRRVSMSGTTTHALSS